MNYLSFTFSVDPAHRETLLALLNAWNFESFEEREKELIGYLPEEAVAPDFLEKLQAWMDTLPLEVQLSEQKIPDQNWNEQWEANFQPIRVNDFCGLRADFHPPFDPPVEYDLRIQPRMAFGTGHHATTYMMLKHMQELPDTLPPSVLDFGCGTGVLAILAAKMAVEEVYAVDIEEASYENTKENAVVNDCPDIRLFRGSLQDVPERPFSLILANINRNVILHYLPALYDRLEAEGRLWVSGILEEDESLVRQTAEKAGFSWTRTDRRNQWLFMEFLK